MVTPIEVLRNVAGGNLKSEEEALEAIEEAVQDYERLLDFAESRDEQETPSRIKDKYFNKKGLFNHISKLQDIYRDLYADEHRDFIIFMSQAYENLDDACDELQQYNDKQGEQSADPDNLYLFRMEDLVASDLCEMLSVLEKAQQRMSAVNDLTSKKGPLWFRGAREALFEELRTVFEDQTGRKVSVVVNSYEDNRKHSEFGVFVQSVLNQYGLPVAKDPKIANQIGNWLYQSRS